MQTNMFMMKTSFVVLVLVCRLWISCGAAPSNSNETVTVATNEDVFTTLSDSEATTADSVTEPEVIGCNGTVCDEHASCLNTTGELKCTCDNGYYGDGLNCSVDWCINNPCDTFASCHNGPTNYTCSCLPGFEIHRSHCRDINECFVNGRSIDEEICGQHAKCRNTLGSFECSCNAGYYREAFQCYLVKSTCEPGFKNNGSHCQDINECFVNGQHTNEEICGQHAKCINTQGSFVCTCNAGYYREDSQCYATSLRRDCADVREQGHTVSGIYTVFVGESARPLDVYCDMTTGSVGWMVFQRRQDGSVDFQLNWAEYQKGFGDMLGEFWIGNDNLHLLTSNKRYKLRVELTAFDGTTAFAEFDNFKVASSADKYKLTSIGKYSGTAGDSLTYHVGQQFSTKDQDNDSHSGNCAVERKGAWWYNVCANNNLNGFYYKTATVNLDSVYWWHPLKIDNESLRRVEMKLTPFV